MTKAFHQQVKAGFNRAADKYDEYAGLQRIVARTLFEQAKGDISQNAQWLDIGCGTGFLQELLRSSGNKATLLQLDIAPAMCQIAASYASNAAYGNTHTINADMAALPIKDASLDGVLSSLALQWSGDLLSVLRQALRVLKSGGVLHASIMGEGSLQELRHCYEKLGRNAPILDFYAAKALREFAKQLPEAIIHVEEKPITLHYENVMQLLKGLRGIGASYRGQREQLASRGFFAALEAFYQQYYGSKQGVVATWNILYVTATKR